MRNFLIVFHEKTGTSPLVRLLDKFEQISILHQENNTGFEPFDRHNCGRMSLRDLRRCLDIIYGSEPKDRERLNRIYTKTAKRPLEAIGENGVVGFKMRFRPPNSNPFRVDDLPVSDTRIGRSIRLRYLRYFREAMFDVLKRNDVVVLMAVRQDVLRWGLSKYHGDGTGKPGHIQFELALGNVSRRDIGTIDVDCERLESIISTCESLHQEDRLLMQALERAGIRVHPVLFEDFLTDKRSYLRDLFGALELEILDAEITDVLSQEEYFKKVHPDDISEFVENHEEVTDRFSDRFVGWQ